MPETRSKQEENPVVTEESNNPMNNDDIASIRTIIEKAKSLI